MKSILAMLIAVLLLLLTGCGDKTGDSAEAPEDSPVITETPAPTPEPSTVPTPEPTPDPTSEPPPVPQEQGIPENVQPLSESEMTYFQTEYFSNTDRSVTANRFLASDYDSPEDVDLKQLFYEGTSLENQAPEYEHDTIYAAIADAWGVSVDEVWKSGDLTKVPAADAEAVLMRYVGLTMEETNGVGAEDMYYVPEYDAYYLMINDLSLCQWVTLTAGWQEENGDVWLEYGYSDFPEEPLRIMGIVRLTETESGWMIRENHRL